ncbi:hypothetical protein KBX50_29615 [Micromonospora sp. C51]|uniref:hypothetical protein n=1 Tax=Micromonospora sp. C51 TaxID=2824879 RepID=UPI001B3963A0|nr:hypothetical protein [Micromonospora sp. C51]MBQ1052597.1 hypothetical protein [Micromonospora sp. C51]
MDRTGSTRSVVKLPGGVRTRGRRIGDPATPAEDAIDWVRAAYRPGAVETPWQRRWLRRLSAS